MSLFPKVGRRQPSVRVWWYVVIALLVLGIGLHLLPFYYMITTSIKPQSEILGSPPSLFPRALDLSGWQLVFRTVVPSESNDTLRNLMPRPLGVYFRNSVIMALGALAVSLPITAFAAYANSKLQRGRSARWFFFFFIGTLMLPEIVTLIPRFLLTRNFPFPLSQVPLIPGTLTPFPSVRIWDTLWAIILPAGFNAFGFLLFKGYFDTIPDSVIQAARVDGGSEFNIFRRIVFPMSIPVFAVVAWFQFAGLWDSFLWPTVVLQSVDNIPMSVAINNLFTRFASLGMMDASRSAGSSMAMQELIKAGFGWPAMMVLGILQTIPIFVMFIICREFLLKGVRIRGLK